MKIRTLATKEAAKKQLDEIQAHLDTTMMTIYTDGSRIEGKIGAAAYNIVNDKRSKPPTSAGSRKISWYETGNRSLTPTFAGPGRANPTEPSVF